jgi:hypothetical protein
MPAAFITGSVTAFLVQDNRWAGVQSGALRRGADGVIMGLLWGLGYQVALEIMPLIDVPVPKDQMPLLWIALGVAIGVLLPEQFRRPWQSRLREAIGSAKPTSITTPG